MLAREKSEETAWARMFRTDEAQELRFHALSANILVRSRVRKIVSNVGSAWKGVPRDDLFHFIGFSRVVSCYRGVTVQEKKLRGQKRNPAHEKLLRILSNTDVYDISWWQTAPF